MGTVYRNPYELPSYRLEIMPLSEGLMEELKFRYG